MNTDDDKEDSREVGTVIPFPIAKEEEEIVPVADGEPELGMYRCPCGSEEGFYIYSNGVIQCASSKGCGLLAQNIICIETKELTDDFIPDPAS